VWFTALFIACEGGNEKGDDGLNVVTVNISYMCCLPDVIRRTWSLIGGAVQVG
jgi:hypothetical protein